MSVDNSVAIVLAAFEAVERRDQQRLRELYHPEVEFQRCRSAMDLTDILWLEGRDEVPMPATPGRWSSWPLTHGCRRPHVMAGSW